MVVKRKRWRELDEHAARPQPTTSPAGLEDPSWYGKPMPGRPSFQSVVGNVRADNLQQVLNLWGAFGWQIVSVSENKTVMGQGDGHSWSSCRG